MRKDDKDIKRNEEEDDNRVIADMNIDGMQPHNVMRWDIPVKPLYEESKMPVPELSKKEIRRITASATLGGLLIGTIFLIIFFLFIMFCIHIWF